MEHCACIASIDDVKRYAEIWQHKHAVEVCKIFSEVFGDMILMTRSEDSGESEEDNDDHEDLSIYFQNDTSFLEMIESLNSLDETALTVDVEENVHQANYPVVLDSAIQNVLINE